MERIIAHNTNNRDGLLWRSESRSAATTSSDFVLQWGNRKRLRCMKVQVKDRGLNSKDASISGPIQLAPARIDRRVVDLNRNSNKDPSANQLGNYKGGNRYLNLRQRPASPSPRILRNSKSSIGGMRGHSNGARDKKPGGPSINNSSHLGTNRSINSDNYADHSNGNCYHHNGGGASGGGLSETAFDGRKGGSLSGGSDAVTTSWPPKVVIALTNKEKEEDFMAIKGSKLPQRPKKRAKFIQRTLNLVSPGAWLCDLTLERYEVRKKRASKKRARGLKAMSNMDSDSE